MSNATSETATSDVGDQLVSVTLDPRDGNGNPVAVNTFNNADQPLTRKVGTAAATAYTVDADGNVTGDGAGNTYVYDLTNRVKSSVASGTAWAWASDGDGNLVKQTGSATYTSE